MFFRVETIDNKESRFCRVDGIFYPLAVFIGTTVSPRLVEFSNIVSACHQFSLRAKAVLKVTQSRANCTVSVMSSLCMIRYSSRPES